MRGHLKRLTGIFLCMVMVLGNLPVNALAAEQEETGKYLPTDQAVTISAEAENTVTVKETEEDDDDDGEDKPVEEVEGALKLQAGEYSIARDYQQECMITVTNQSETAQSFYLEAVNNYSDISLEIVNSGNKNNPMIIEPGESLEVKLAVFAQNAERENYYVPITTYVLQGEEYVQDAQVSANLSCTIPTLDITWEKMSEDASTLRQKYKITNNGDALTDLVVSAAGDLEDYVSFSPILSNYELQKGASVEFTVQPDLAKMKKNNVSLLSGTLTASCAGQTSSTACAFDTKGQEITVTTMSELAMQQDGNPFTKFEIVEDSILFQYFNGEEYVDVTDETAFDEIVGEDGLINFSYQTDADLGVEEPVNFEMSVKSSVYEGSDSSVDSDPVITREEDGTIRVTVQTVLSAEEYEKYINDAKESAQIAQPEEQLSEDVESNPPLEENSISGEEPETENEQPENQISEENETDIQETDQSSEDAYAAEAEAGVSETVNGESESEEKDTTQVPTAVLQSFSSEKAAPVSAVTTAETTEDPVEEGERFLLETTFKVNSASDAFGGPNSKVLDIFGNVYDVCTWVEEGEDTYNVITDPTLDNSTKACYTLAYVMKGLLKASSIAVGFAKNPVLSFAYGFATDWLDGMLDKYQAALLYEANPQKYAALYEEVFGYQCTNRGSIGASFYAPDYGTTSGIKPSIHVSSRMYEEDDSYSDRADTNYDITLNGEPAGETQNAGVTDIAMAEISSDQLKPGEVNVLEMDYDTSPGHYFVSTETKVTMVYPGDTEIGYIGSPEDLENVRLQPDFEIHPENIYTQSELIEGESAVVMFNVYNTGSRGGWFDVTGYDGDRVIFNEKNFYLAAFGQKTFLVNWTPTANSSEITVTLTNTSVDLDELDGANNSATKTLTVRQREIPEIRNLNTGVIFENSGYSMSADVAGYADVSNVSFAVDGTPVNGTMKSSENGSYARYQISSAEGLAAGGHSVTVTVEYQTISGTESVSKDFSVTVQEQVIVVPSVEVRSGETILYGSDFEFSVNDAENLTRTAIVLDGGAEEIVEVSGEENARKEYSVSTANWEPGSHSVVIKLYYQGKNGEETVEETANITLISREDSYYTFALSEDITNPQFSVYNSGSVRQNCEPIQAEDGSYSFLKTVDMYENPENYTLVVQYDSGLLTKSLEENGSTINTEDGNTFTLNTDQTDRISSVRIVNAGSLYLNASMPVSGQLTLTPGTYTVSVSVYLGGQVYFSRTLDLDLSSGDQAVNLRDLVTEYTFRMEGSTATNYRAAIYYRNAGSSYWYNQGMSTVFDESSRILKCYVTSSYALDRIEQAEEVRIVVSSDDEVYLVQMKAPVSVLARIMGLNEEQEDDCITLNRDSLNKVSLVCGEEGLSFEQAEVSTDLYSVTLYRSTVYLPEDTYTIKATLNTGYQTVIGEVEAEISQDMEVEVDEAWSDRLSDVTIRWAEQFDKTAHIESSTSAGSRISADDFANGDVFKVESGYRNFSVDLTQGEVDFYITKSMDIDDQNTGIQIDSRFNGKIYTSFPGEYEGGSTVSFYLSDLYDENDNRLSSFYAYRQPLYGNVIFTDVNNADNVHVLPITATGSSMSMTLPEKAGTYQIQVELFTYATKEDEEHVHTVVVDEGVPATCTANGLTEGSHCSVCGEVLVVQTEIPALGHSYDAPAFQWNSDNSCIAKATCTVCGEIQEIECTVEEMEGEAGQTVYTATAEINGQTYTDTKTVENVPENPEQPGDSGDGEETDPEKPGDPGDGEETDPEKPSEPGDGEETDPKQPESADDGQEDLEGTDSDEKPENDKNVKPTTMTEVNDGKTSVSETEKKNSANADTGDDQTPVLWAVLAAVSGGGLILVCRSRKKKNSK